MKVLKIKDNYNLQNLIKDYGFRQQDCYNIYIYDLDKNTDEHSSILVNTTDNEERILWFFYSNEDEEGYSDYAIEIPEILFKMIQDGIIEVIEKED